MLVLCSSLTQNVSKNKRKKNEQTNETLKMTCPLFYPIPFKTPFLGLIFLSSFRLLSFLKAFFFRDSRNKTHTHFSHCFAKEEFLCKLLKMIKMKLKNK